MSFSFHEKTRPNPEELLKVVQKQSEKKGQLRVFLGMCPGVGKTYAMLKAAQEMRASKRSVVVGFVETHGRKDTEKILEGLKVIAPLEINYRGTIIKEMNLEAIISLPTIPDILLVDELAHQNLPGSRHQKRYQDVAELLHLGFNVYTTVNIQHIESRNDQVAQITGIVVKETVPDSFLEEANEVEVVDLSPSELLKRLAEGKVYIAERAERAAKNFFQEEKLTALRELALRFTAEKVDQDLTQQMTLKGIEGPWNTNERFLVAVSSSPNSVRLIRAARRMAYNLDAPWIALHVNSGKPLDEEDSKNLQRTLNLAQELGAEVISMADVNVTKAIENVATDKNVTQVVMGRPIQSFWRDLFRGGDLLEKLVHTKIKIDIHILRGEPTRKKRSFRSYFPEFNTKLSAYFLTTLLILGVSGIFYSLLPYLGHRFLGSGFLLALIIVSGFARRGLIIYTSIAFAFLWYLVFISPPFSFFNRKWEDGMLVLTFFFTAITAGWLTARLRKQEIFLRKRESRSAMLYEFTKKISDVATVEDVPSILCEALHTFIQGEIRVILATPQNELLFEHSSLSVNDMALASWVYEHLQKAGKFTPTLSGSNAIAFPILSESASASSAEGILLIYPKADYLFQLEDETLIETLTHQAGNSLKKFNLEKLALHNRYFQQRARLHDAMMKNLNLEVKGPIEHSIMLAQSLVDFEKEDSFVKNKGVDLLKTMRRLDLVVDNLIYFSQLEENQAQLEWKKIDCKTLLEEILEHWDPENNSSTFSIQNQFAGKFYGDPILLKQAFTNLLVYVLKVNPAWANIQILLFERDHHLILQFVDQSISVENQQALGQKFQQENFDEESLSLNLARKVISLHGGQMRSFQLEQQQCNCFEIQLPLSKTPSF